MKTDIEHKPSIVCTHRPKGIGESDEVVDLNDDNDVDIGRNGSAPKLTEGAAASSKADEPPIAACTVPIKIKNNV